MTLTKKITLYTTILGVFPIILISLLYFFYFVPNIKGLINKKVDVITEVVADEVSRAVAESVNGVSILANSNVFIDSNSTKEDYLEEIKKSSDMYDILKDISLLNTKGEILASENYSFRELDSTWWFKEALKKRVVLSDVHAVLYPLEFVMTVSCPVLYNDEVTGILVGHINLEYIRNIIKQKEKITGFELWIIDSNGLVIESPFSDKILDRFPDDYIYKKSKEMSKVNTIISRNKEDYFCTLTPIKTIHGEVKLNWNIMSALNEDVMYKTLNEFKKIFFLRGLLSLTFFVFIVMFLRRSIKARILSLREATQKLGEGDYSVDVLDKGNDEVSDLIKVFNNTRLLLKDSEDRIKKANKRFKLAVKGAKDVIWDWDIIEDRFYISPKWWYIVGSPAVEDDYIDIYQFTSFIHADDRSYFENQLNSYLSDNEINFEVEYRIHISDGGIRWILTRGIVVRDKDGTNIRMAGSHTDITSRKIMQQKMAFNAFYDTLTELPNRNMLLDRLKQALSRASRNSNFSFSVLFLDFDGFKHINDTYGHDVGDQLLIDIGNRLKECIRPLDIVSRIGGDEFVILIDGVGDEKELVPILNRIIITSKNEFQIKNKSIFTSVSIGAVIEGTGESEPDELIQRSDIAMYHSKLTGKSRFTFFTEELRKDEITRWSLENELHKALGTSEIQIYYQPIINTETEEVSSFEALMRWIHPQKGVIPPIDFIPAAEDTGFITNITKWLINHILIQAKIWNEKLNDKIIVISFNVTAKDFFISGGLDRFIRKMLEKTGCNPGYLAMEVTESVMIKDFENVTKQLKSLRKMGIKIKLDDFGTGYSSLSYLNKFEIDYIKIDRSFIQTITEDRLSEKIVKAIILLAKDIELKIVAEGVEKIEEVKLLKSWGCEFIQGYFYSEPLTSQDADIFLNLD